MSTSLENRMRVLQAYRTIQTLQAWDFEQFKTVMIALGLKDSDKRIPSLIPTSSIHLQALSPVIRELVVATRSESRRHSRALFVDRYEGKLLIGDITKGSHEDGSNVGVAKDSRYADPKMHEFIGSIRTNDPNRFEFGFNGSDYASFMLNASEQFMLMTFGDKFNWLALKTGSTTNQPGRGILTGIIRDVVNEPIPDALRKSVEIKLDFRHKLLAASLGLILFKSHGTDLYERIRVADDVERD